jgi:hypothetical protein
MRDRLRKLWPVVKALLGLAIVVIIGRRFYLSLRDHPEVWRQPLRPGWLLLCGGLYLLGLAFSALCWHRLMRSLDQRPPFLVALRAYYIGHMGKYLPGKAWAVFLRGSLMRGQGTTPLLATATAFYEVFVTMSAGVLVAAVLFALLLPPGDTRLGSGRVRHQVGAMLEEVAKPENQPIDWGRLRREVTQSDEPGAPLDRTLALVLCVGPLVPLLLPTLPPVFNRLAHHLSLPFRDGGAALPPFVPRGLAEGLLATGLGWLCLGGSLYAALRGTLPDPPPWTGDAWGLLTAIMGVSYVAGFVVLIAPSGLGVREFFQVMFLAALLGYPPAAEEASLLLAVLGGRPEWLGVGTACRLQEASLLLSVLVLRLVWTVSEVVMIALVWRLPGPAVFGRREGVS